MPIRKLRYEGDPLLLQKSRVVTDFNDRLHQLLDDMKDTLVNEHGAGLAAPQVGVLRQVAIVFDLDEETEETKTIEMVNPEIIHSEGEQEGPEGCLSLPGYQGIVKRPMRVRVRAQNRYGEFFEEEGEGFLARAFCHEIDHLHGIIYTSIAEEVYELNPDDEDDEG